MMLEAFFLDPKPRAKTKIQHPLFERLIVEKKSLEIEGEHYNVLCIPSITSKNPGSGSFRTLLREIWSKHDIPVMITHVVSNHFQEGLERMGFTRVENEFKIPPHYFKLPLKFFV